MVLEMPHECRLVNVFGVWVWLLSVFTSLPFVLLKWHGCVKGGVDGAEEKESERGEGKGKQGVTREQWSTATARHIEKFLLLATANAKIVNNRKRGRRKNGHTTTTTMENEEEEKEDKEQQQ